MAENWEEVYEEVVFAVTRLMFGDDCASLKTYRNVIRHALNDLGVEEEVYEEVVFAVTGLMFGDDCASLKTYRNVIRHALNDLGVEEVIKKLTLKK